MLRDIDLNEVTDGKQYISSDVVNITCDDCAGCSECCRTVGDTITLDPLDIFNLSRGLNKSFVDMLENEIELRLIDGIILPNIMIEGDSDACSMLDSEGRCTIHNLRPGFCRLYPLGRLYDEGGDFKYIIQVHECPHPHKGPIRISDWLGIEDLDKYEAFIRSWHAVVKHATDYAASLDEETDKKKAMWKLIRIFYEKPYDLSRDFYEQYYERLG